MYPAHVHAMSMPKLNGDVWPFLLPPPTPPPEKTSPLLGPTQAGQTVGTRNVSTNSSADGQRLAARKQTRGQIKHVREKTRWLKTIAAHNATGFGSRYPWSERRKGIWEPARNSKLDYLWKPLPQHRDGEVWPSWEKQLKLLPKAQPPAGIIYMQIGSWPPWMPFLLASTAANTLVTFYFIGGSPIDVSADCKHCTWLPLNESGFRQRLKSFVGVELRRRSKKGKEVQLVGKKLNDLKPAIGVLFPELAQRHKWIGFSDPDVILGNISHEVSLLRDENDLFVPMERFPEPLANGNFMLLRCRPNILNAFRRSRRWREVFQSPKPMAFDEWHFEGESRHATLGSKILDRRYLASSYEAWQEMLLSGELKPQPASRMLVQDAIIQEGVHGMYPLLDSFGARVNFTWREGQLVVSRRGPCVCPSDVIPQLGIASCPQCIKHRGVRPSLDPVDIHGVPFMRNQTGKPARPTAIILDRTVEVMGVHFQMWKKLWRSREFRLIRALQGLRPPPDVIYSAIPDCRLSRSVGTAVTFHMDGTGFSCGRTPLA